MIDDSRQVSVVDYSGAKGENNTHMLFRSIKVRISAGGNDNRAAPPAETAATCPGLYLLTISKCNRSSVLERSAKHFDIVLGQM